MNVYGDVLTCPFLHLSVGNVRDSKLKDLHARALANRWFNHHHPRCLACEDKEFFERYVSKTFQSDRTPLSWDEVFGDN